MIPGPRRRFSPTLSFGLVFPSGAQLFGSADEAERCRPGGKWKKTLEGRNTTTARKRILGDDACLRADAMFHREDENATVKTDGKKRRNETRRLSGYRRQGTLPFCHPFAATPSCPSNPRPFAVPSSPSPSLFIYPPLQRDAIRAACANLLFAIWVCGTLTTLPRRAADQ